MADGFLALTFVANPIEIVRASFRQNSRSWLGGTRLVVSPLIAGYPLVTLLLSRAFLEKEDVGPQLIAGVTGAVCGVVLLLVA